MTIRSSKQPFWRSLLFLFATSLISCSSTAVPYRSQFFFLFLSHFIRFSFIYVFVHIYLQAGTCYKNIYSLLVKDWALISFVFLDFQRVGRTSANSFDEFRVGEMSVPLDPWTQLELTWKSVWNGPISTLYSVLWNVNRFGSWVWSRFVISFGQQNRSRNLETLIPVFHYCFTESPMDLQSYFSGTGKSDFCT